MSTQGGKGKKPFYVLHELGNQEGIWAMIQREKKEVLASPGLWIPDTTSYSCTKGRVIVLTYSLFSNWS